MSDKNAPTPEMLAAMEKAERRHGDYGDTEPHHPDGGYMCWCRARFHTYQAWQAHRLAVIYEAGAAKAEAGGTDTCCDQRERNVLAAQWAGKIRRAMAPGGGQA